MNYPFELFQYPNENFELKKSVWTGKITLLRNEKIVEPYDLKDKLYILPLGNTEKVSLQVKDNFYDFASHLAVNGARLDIVPSIKWYNYLFGALPLCLLFIGGALGAGIGVGATYLNLSILRNNVVENKLMKYGKVLAINIGAYLFYLLLATLLNQLFFL